MESQQTPEPVTVAVDEVEVVKRLDLEMFPAPTVVFEITSERAEPVALRLVESNPEVVSDEDIGFHPDYGAEHWTTKEEVLVFEHELAGGDQYTTVFAIRGDKDDIEPFFAAAPSLDVDPEGQRESASLENRIPTEDAAKEQSEDAMSDGGSNDDSISKLREEISAQRSVDRGDVNAEQQSNISTSTVVEQLIDDVRSGAIPDETLNELREVLRPREGSIDARIARVQTELSNLQAYSDALESFLDENGTGEQLIEGFDARLDDIEQDVESMNSSINSNETQIDSMTETTNRVEEDLDQMHEEMGDVQASLERLQAEYDELDERVYDGDLAASIEDMQDDIGTLTEWQGRLNDAFSLPKPSETDTEEEPPE